MLQHWLKMPSRGKRRLKLKAEDFLGKPCRTKAAFEFIPKRNLKFDLGKLAGKFREKGIEIEAETPFMLILKVDGTGIELFENGQVTVKGILEESRAKKALQGVAEFL